MLSMSVPVWKQDPHDSDADHMAAVPLADWTAYQAIVDHLKAKAGERLLILGASGGAGGFAGQ
jgi:NADPH:quinone reductase-like Zn-dependent oxidoreductase